MFDPDGNQVRCRVVQVQMTVGLRSGFFFDQESIYTFTETVFFLTLKQILPLPARPPLILLSLFVFFCGLTKVYLMMQFVLRDLQNSDLEWYLNDKQWKYS